LAPLVYAAAESECRSPRDEAFDQPVATELVRVLGSELAEQTPHTLHETAIYLANRQEGNHLHRSGLIPIVKELAQASARLKALAHGPALSVDFVEAIESAQQTVERARLRAAIPASFVLHGIGEWDPFSVLARLEQLLSSNWKRLLTELNRLHQPLVIAVDEALPVARSILGGPPSRKRAALLALARSLDDFCRRAPLGLEDLQQLATLTQKADLERSEEGWQALADKLWQLRKRLFGRGEAPAPPIYRKHQIGSDRRPDSLREMIPLA